MDEVGGRDVDFLLFLYSLTNACTIHPLYHAVLPTRE